MGEAGNVSLAVVLKLTVYPKVDDEGKPRESNRTLCDVCGQYEVHLVSRRDNKCGLLLLQWDLGVQHEQGEVLRQLPVPQLLGKALKVGDDVSHAGQEHQDGLPERRLGDDDFGTQVLHVDGHFRLAA